MTQSERPIGFDELDGDHQGIGRRGSGGTNRSWWGAGRLELIASMSDEGSLLFGLHGSKRETTWVVMDDFTADDLASMRDWFNALFDEAEAIAAVRDEEARERHQTDGIVERRLYRESPTVLVFAWPEPEDLHYIQGDPEPVARMVRAIRHHADRLRGRGRVVDHDDS